MESPAFALHLFEKTRSMIAKSVRDLTEDQLLVIPDGFQNNILWNIGHIIVLQQANVYGRSGLAPLIDLDTMRPLFNSRTSPADWQQTPDAQALLDMLVSHATQLTSDFENGKFEGIDYQSRTAGNGVHMATVEQAMLYNNCHETMHLGAIEAIKDFVTP